MYVRITLSEVTSPPVDRRTADLPVLIRLGLERVPHCDSGCAFTMAVCETPALRLKIDCMSILAY